MQVTSKPVLKDAYTNSLYQSTFLPIFERAETRIKELIFAAFLFGRNKYFLRLAIAEVIAQVSKKIPVELVDRDVYLSSLTKKSEFYISKYYDQQLIKYGEVRKTLLTTVQPGMKVPNIENPKQLYDFVQSKSMWAEAKGFPNVVNYAKEVRQYVNEFGGDPFTIIENGKKPITLWQKAELDVRYDNQMQMLQNLRVEGVEYAWTSSHPNASKRCAPWQGKLMALEGHATMSGFRMGKLDGKWVYSLVDIMNQTDKYGYHNNIICGFNCRHKLIPYKPGSVAPTQYNKKELEEQRAIELKIRELEREIRKLKKKTVLFEKLGDKATVRQLKAKIKALTDYYKRYCEVHGYAWYDYRISI